MPQKWQLSLLKRGRETVFIFPRAIPIMESTRRTKHLSAEATVTPVDPDYAPTCTTLSDQDD